MAVNHGFFNYFKVLSEENLESKNPNRGERKLGPTLNPAMKDENFIRDLKKWSRDYGNPESDDYIPFREFLDRYPKYFPKSTGTGQLPVKNCTFKPEWFSYPVDAIDMTLDKQSASSLPSGTHFERCKFTSENDTSTFVLDNNSLVNCEFIGNFDRSKIKDSNLESLDFTRASLKGSHFKESALTGVDFSGASMKGTTFDNAHVSACNFSNANMEKVKIINNSNFYASNFQKANMIFFQLGSRHVKENNPDKSSVNNCDLTYADLREGIVECDAILEKTVFNASAAAEAAQLYQSYFPSDTNCFLPHIGITCTNLYEDRVKAMIGESGDDSLMCTDMMPASSCGSDVKGLRFGAGIAHGTPMRGVTYTHQAILYGQLGNNSYGVDNAFAQEGMNNPYKATPNPCMTQSGFDEGAVLLSLFLGGSILAIFGVLVYGLCQRARNLEETQPLIEDSYSINDEENTTTQSRAFGRRCC